MQRADAVPLAGVRLEIGLRRRLALLAQRLGPPPVAHEHRIGAVDRLEHEPRQRPPSPPSASRKYTQLPSGARSTSPASASSFRWRLMRGWLWPRMPVRSLTLSSPDASSTSTRSRVGSAIAFSAATEVFKASCTCVS